MLIYCLYIKHCTDSGDTTDPLATFIGRTERQLSGRISVAANFTTVDAAGHSSQNSFLADPSTLTSASRHHPEELIPRTVSGFPENPE